MAAWTGLRERLADVEDELTIAWPELDALVGGLPPSAYEHRAFWGGERSGWPGFRTTDVRIGQQVTFVRSGAAVAATPGIAEHLADLILVGCVKSKRHHAAPAKDLYTSALFLKERAYAEASGKPWFILSAKHGLVSPDEVIEPYDVYLKAMPAAYREWWGRTVMEQFATTCGSLRGLTVEIHAAATYVDQIAPRLGAAGVAVVTPLDGLAMGQRLAWYGRGVVSALEDPSDSDKAPTGQHGLPTIDEASAVLHRLQSRESGLPPAEFIASGGRGLRHPGMYSWWVDEVGAAMLSEGLELRIDPRLIYAGLAGATHTKSGKESTNTLWGRINGMHLGGRHEFSTFRRSLGSILAEALAWPHIDEQMLTAWMYEHLRVIAVPVSDADTLDALETMVLRELDPPLNLMKMPRTPIRSRLSELRRQHSRS